MVCEVKKFEKCIEKVNYTTKIQKNKFQTEGEFPIISQEQEFINGYWDNVEDVFKIKKPVVIFGDHTQVLKYIDFDFVLGADGVKILQPIKDINSKYFYYYLISVNMKSVGYARHYKFLKEKDVPVPPLPVQKQIVDILDKSFEKISKAKENAEKKFKNLEELEQSILKKTFSDKL